jgi:acetyl esterase/lipase
MSAMTPYALILSVAFSPVSLSCLGAEDATPPIFTKGGGFTPDKVIPFKKTDGRPLELHVFYPDDFKKGEERPGIVFFFGGGWKGGSPSQMYCQSAYLASRGMVAISAQYRTYSRYKAQPFTCVEDGKSAVRYVRQHAKEIGINPNKLAVGGGSAGGHVAAATATVKDYDCEKDDLSISAIGNALVLFNPVYDNGPNGYGYDRVKDYYKKISPIDNLDGKQPPTIVFFGDRDKHIPVETAKLYERRMKENGNRCETHIYKGRKHGFFNLHKGKKEDFIDTVTEMDKFLVSLGFLSGEPHVVEWLNEQEKR